MSNLYQIGCDAVGVAPSHEREPVESPRPRSPVSSPPGGSWGSATPLPAPAPQADYSAETERHASQARHGAPPPPPPGYVQPYTPPAIPAPVYNAHVIPANANYQVLSWGDGTPVDDNSLPYGQVDEFSVPYNPLPDSY